MTRPWDSRIARILVLPLRGTSVRPNHLTTLGLLTGLTSAALYAHGGTHGADLGAVLLVAAMIVDHADGELARMTGTTSELGRAYDRVADLSVKLCTFLGMGLGLGPEVLGGWGAALGASAGLALLTIFGARSALARRRGDAALTQPALAGFEIEDVLYLIAPVTWLGGLPSFVAAAGLGAPLFALWTLYGLQRAVAADRGRAGGGGVLWVSRSSSAQSWARPGLAIGVALFTIVIAYHGVGEVARAVAAAGWGLLAVAAFHAVPLVADALGWRSLLSGVARPSAVTFVRARWIGESVNGLLPVLQVGGNVAKARALARARVPGVLAGASVVVDVTLVVLTQILFALLGVAILVAHFGGGAILVPVLVGTALTFLMAAGFVAAQRAGLFGAGLRLVERLGGHLGLGEGFSAQRAGELDAGVLALYGKRRAVIASASWHLASWLVGTGEVWLALYFLGHPVTLPSALLLESLGQAVRAAAFAVPGALGVQEGGFVVLGALVGLDPQTCLALSLCKRARELLLGLPGLVMWQAGASRSSLDETGDRVEVARV